MSRQRLVSVHHSSPEAAPCKPPFCKIPLVELKTTHQAVKKRPTAETVKANLLRLISAFNGGDLDQAPDIKVIEIYARCHPELFLQVMKDMDFRHEVKEIIALSSQVTFFSPDAFNAYAWLRHSLDEIAQELSREIQAKQGYRP